MSADKITPSDTPKIARWLPMEGSLLERSSVGWFVSYEDYRRELAALRTQLAEREKELENLRLHLSDKNRSLEIAGATRVKLEAELAAIKGRAEELWMCLDEAGYGELEEAKRFRAAFPKEIK